MLKNSLAILVIGAVAAGNGFAMPNFGSKQFLKEHMIKSSLPHPVQNNPSKFNGKWTGVCDFGGQNNEVRLHIEDTNEFLYISDMDYPSGGQDPISYNVVTQENTSSSSWYYNSTSRLTRVNDNTLKHEGTGVGGPQLDFPPSTKYQDQESGLNTVLFTTIYSLSNNQLTIDTHAKMADGNKNSDRNFKCVLNRTG